MIAVHPVSASPATESWVPLPYATPMSISIANRGDRPSRVALARLSEGREVSSTTFSLAPGETVVREVSGLPTGASAVLRIRSTAPVEAAGGTYAAVPTDEAVGTGGSAIIPVIASPVSPRLYATEVNGFSVAFEVSLLDADGDVIRRDLRYLEAFRQDIWDLPPSTGSVRIAGVNGSGKVIASSLALLEGGRPVASPMIAYESREFTLPIPEALAYTAAGLALVAAVFRRRGV